MQKITPFLWFDSQAEEAANFYVSIFKDSRIKSVSRYGEGGPGAKGSVMSVTFQLEGQDFMALNGGPLFTFTPAVSFFVNCETQQEIDELWEKLTAGGEEVQVRLAERQVWSFLADHSHGIGRDVAGPGPGEIEASHASPDADEQA